MLAENTQGDAAIDLEAGIPPDPEREMQQLFAMTEFLARTRKSPRAQKVAEKADQVLSPQVLERLHAAMRRLLGGDVLLRHRRCISSARHERRRICRDCGYSDNLYLQELERILKRIRLPAEEGEEAAAAAAKAKKK